MKIENTDFFYILFYSSTFNMSNDNDIAMLMSMGFDLTQSQHALSENGGNLERSIDYLLSGGGGSVGGTISTDNNVGNAGNDSRDNSGTTTIVQSFVSQYSDPLGRSACTCIALTMAQNFLKSHTNDMNKESAAEQRAHNVQEIIDSAFLDKSIYEGIQNYAMLGGGCTNTNSGDHSSVDELLSKDSAATSPLFLSMQVLENSPRQGILDSHSSSVDLHNNPMGLSALLGQCQGGVSSSHALSTPYIAAVITKPPETVLVLLPLSSANLPYVLLDSHPRPNQLSPHYPHGAYGLFHPSMTSLVSSLKQIFPVTELGNDVPEMMAMMYNSFDVYPFLPKGV